MWCSKIGGEVILSVHEAFDTIKATARLMPAHIFQMKDHSLYTVRELTSYGY
jgi:hypothetical protein